MLQRLLGKSAGHPGCRGADLLQCRDLPVVVVPLRAGVDTKVEGIVMTGGVAAEVEGAGVVPLIGGVWLGAVAEPVGYASRQAPAWVAQALQQLIVPAGRGWAVRASIFQLPPSSQHWTR